MVLGELSCPHQGFPLQVQHRPGNNKLINIIYGTPKRSIVPSSAKSFGFSINSVFKKCEGCRGQGSIECPGCKGTGRNKKNGNIFERWKCFECQGFGLKGCPVCGKGGLTPEQRGER